MESSEPLISIESSSIKIRISIDDFMEEIKFLVAAK